MTTYIKSPLNYTGGKFKLLPQILPLFPTDIYDFVDLFGGGGNVVANVSAQKSLYNDFDSKVMELLHWMGTTHHSVVTHDMDALISEYDLSKTNKEGYLALRQKYNDGERTPVVLYTLICYAFNNQIRFNSKGEYNIPFGKDRSFNPTLRSKLIDFCERLDYLINAHQLVFTSSSFDTVSLSSSAFVYCDPPYLISTATYNEKNGWGLEEEAKLLTYLDNLNESGIRFALSNVIDHGGQTNELLNEFSKGYRVHDLTMTYSNASYQKKDKTSKSREVLIVNY